MKDVLKSNIKKFKKKKILFYSFAEKIFQSSESGINRIFLIYAKLLFLSSYFEGSGGGGLMRPNITLLMFSINITKFLIIANQDFFLENCPFTIGRRT